MKARRRAATAHAERRRGRPPSRAAVVPADCGTDGKSRVWPDDCSDAGTETVDSSVGAEHLTKQDQSHCVPPFNPLAEKIGTATSAPASQCCDGQVRRPWRPSRRRRMQSGLRVTRTASARVDARRIGTAGAWKASCAQAATEVARQDGRSGPACQTVDGDVLRVRKFPQCCGQV